jgi:TPR repeat protein
MQNGDGVGQDLIKAIDYFDLAANQGFPEAQYRCGICLLTDLTIDRNIADGIRFLKHSAENGSPNGQFVVACMSEHGIGIPFDLITAAKYYEGCSNHSPAASVCCGWCLQTGRGIPIDFTVAAEFFKRAADLDDVEAMNSFACCLEQGQGVDADIDQAILYYQKSAKQGHPDGMYTFARCLEYGKGISKDLFRAAKYYRLSAEQNNAAAQNSFWICLERGIGVHKNTFLAAQYYQRAAEQGHVDGANNFGFCLEHGSGVERDIEMATEYYKFAADEGHSEAKLNYNRCLRLLGEWEPSDRSSEIVSHPPSFDHLSHIFRDFLNHPELLDADGRRLFNSFERLKAQSIIPIISNRSPVKWNPNELGSGDSSAVKLSLDSKPLLLAVKTSLNPNLAELVQREADSLKTLKHPLILELRWHASENRDQNATIVTEFAGNQSLAGHLPPSRSCLSGPNRITKVIIGIALAMRFLHSRDIIHRDLTPKNILLDWNWNVQIADFGRSSSPHKPDLPSLTDSNLISKRPSRDVRYIAPECYDGCYFEESDVFSFGMILYELLTGQLTFSEGLDPLQIMFKVVIKDERPSIPEFVLPSAQELITDCWAKLPEDRPSFKEIIERLTKMKFKVMRNVNSAKLSTVVKEIEEYEARNAVGRQ